MISVYNTSIINGYLALPKGYAYVIDSLGRMVLDNERRVVIARYE